MKKNRVFILLAGGKSERMGVPKGLLSYKETYWILAQIQRFPENSSILIGLGYDAEKYFQQIPWMKEALTKTIIFCNRKVRVVVNNKPQFGLFATFLAVLKRVMIIEKNASVVLLPIDVPLLQKNELQKLLAVENDVVIPIYQSKKGHPVKIAPIIWHTFLKINLDDLTARLDTQLKKVSKEKMTLVLVNDKNCILNLNTMDEWQRFIADIQTKI